MAEGIIKQWGQRISVKEEGAVKANKNKVIENKQTNKNPPRLF